MPISIVFTLKPEEDSLISLTLGHYAHAAFLNMVNELNEGLAAELHSPKRDKPFTVSPLQGEFIQQEDKLLVQPDNEYWLRITGVDYQISQLLSELSPIQIGGITIGDALLQVKKIAKNPSEHPWADRISFENLYNSWVATLDKPPRKIALKFYSPTTFRSNGQNVPLPLPRLVFYQLMQKWNQYSPVFLGEDISKIAEKRVVLSRYKLQTHMMHFGNYRQLGFTGDCEFLLKTKGDEIWARVLHLLADFAFYSGVGYKTTMGMGQVRRI